MGRSQGSLACSTPSGGQRRRWRPQGLRLGAALLLLQASGQRTDEEAAENQCFVIVQGENNYYASEFYEGILAWVDAGAPLQARGGGFDVLREPLSFAINGKLEDMTSKCRWAMLGIALANLLLNGQGEQPWPLFVSIPWEDLARARWPIFELVAVWGEHERKRQEANESSRQHHFWRTCLGEEAVDLWLKPEVEAAGKALWASVRKAGPQVSGAVARAGAIAMLKHVDRSSWVHTTGLCGVMPWSLVAYTLSAALQSRTLVAPGYALRLFQAMVQDAYREVRDDEFMQDVVAAPWPVLSMLAEVADHEKRAHPMLDTVQVDSSSASPGSGKFAHMDSGRLAELMETMRVAHSLLDGLGVAYIAIAGTLLGALRHMQVIPWDDDIDLCVDALHEPKLFSLVLAEEAQHLGVGWPKGINWRGKRAVRFLQRERHVIKIEASRSMTFRIVRAAADGGADEEAPFVDIWQCWDTQHPEHWENGEDGRPSEPSEFGVVLMSKKYGPHIPRSAVFPRRKMPFGGMAIWGPADPAEVTRRYLVHGGWSEDFMNTCEGQKVHGSSGNTEYTDSVPCQSLGSFAGPWKPLAPGPETEEVIEAIRGVVADRLPGLDAPQAGDLSIQAASIGSDKPPRLRAEGWLGAAGKRTLWCEALLWRGDKSEDDLLDPGARPSTGQVLRSLACGNPSSEPSFVWEDAWF